MNILDPASTDGSGILVTYIPQSSHKPHQAAQSHSSYFMRIGNKTKAIPHELLRSLFFPKFFPQFNIWVRPRLESNTLLLAPEIQNSGNGTARDTTAVLGIYTKTRCEDVLDHSNWQICRLNAADDMSSVSMYVLNAQRPLHPGLAFLMPCCKFDLSVAKFPILLRFMLYASDSPEQLLEITLDSLGIQEKTKIHATEWFRGDKRVPLASSS